MKKTDNKTEVSTDKKVSVKSLILKPRITEKASLQSSANAYTFIVRNEATKLGLISELKTTQNVTPVKVNISNLPSKQVIVKGKRGVRSGMKKATVFLKKGDTLKM
jgi:ribosomal protein L23